MTNVLDTAADILENGWCKGGMVQKDGSVLKFCSVGAVAAADLGFTPETLDASNIEQREAIDLYAWGPGEYPEAENYLDHNHPALVALKNELVDSKLMDFDKDPWYTVMDWNDWQSSIEVVLEVFRSAARRLG